MDFSFGYVISMMTLRLVVPFFSLDISLPVQQSNSLDTISNFQTKTQMKQCTGVIGLHLQIKILRYDPSQYDFSYAFHIRL